VTGAATIERDLLIVVCAVSGGIHAALVPGHLEEGAAAGTAFAASAALLAVLAAALTRTSGPVAVATATAVLAGLIAAYALAVTVGLPGLHPEPEPVDGLALFTKAVEAIGLGAGVHLLRPKGVIA
jgi:hypothetical protein